LECRFLVLGGDGVRKRSVALGAQGLFPVLILNAVLGAKQRFCPCSLHVVRCPACPSISQKSPEGAGN
jgi:hypothetical protein